MFNARRHTFYDDVHLIVYIIQFVSDASYVVSDICHVFSDVRYFISNIRYFVINGMREDQDLCCRHQRLLLRQSVQSLQRVLDVLPSYKLLEVFF